MDHILSDKHYYQLWSLMNDDNDDESIDEFDCGYCAPPPLFTNLLSPVVTDRQRHRLTIQQMGIK